MLKIQLIINNRQFIIFFGWFLSSMASIVAKEIPGTLHSFHMDNGETRCGHVLGGEGDSIRVQVQLSETQFSKKPIVIVLLKQMAIKKVIPLEWSIWESAEKKADQDALECGWNSMNCLLGIPGSRVGVLGNSLAHILVNKASDKTDTHFIEKSPLLQMAQTLYAAIEGKSCYPEEKIAARAGRLRTWILEGKNREVIDEVKSWKNPPLEASDVLGESLLVEVETLAQAHPRWQQDRFVKPRMIELLDDCLNASLLAFVCHPLREKYAARGLLRSARIYCIAGNSKLAKQTALDALSFYPEFQKQAECILSNLEK